MHFYPKIICCCAKARLIKIMSFIYNQHYRVGYGGSRWSKKRLTWSPWAWQDPQCGQKPTVSFAPHFLAQKFTDKSWRRGWEFKTRDRSPLCWQTQRLWEECIGGVGSPRRIRYGFINEQQAAVAVAIAYLVVSIWKEWEQEREREQDERGLRERTESTGGRPREKVTWSGFTSGKKWRGKVSCVICLWVIAAWKAEDTTMYFSAPFFKTASLLDRLL